MKHSTDGTDDLRRTMKYLQLSSFAVSHYTRRPLSFGPWGLGVTDMPRRRQVRAIHAALRTSCLRRPNLPTVTSATISSLLRIIWSLGCLDSAHAGIRIERTTSIYDVRYVYDEFQLRTWNAEP